MVPLFPLISLLWIAFALVVIVLLTIATTVMSLYVLIKKSGLKEAVSMWILS